MKRNIDFRDIFDIYGSQAKVAIKEDIAIEDRDL